MKMYKILLVLLFTASAFAQVTYQNGLGLGFGVTSPRMFGDAYSEYVDFGGHVFLQKDLDEVNALRLKLDYLHFTENPAPPQPPFEISGRANGIVNNSVALSLDYLFRYAPCGTVKVYLGAGGSVYYFKLKNADKIYGSDLVGNISSFGELSVNVEVGLTYAIANDWDLRVAYGHHTMSTDRFDGIYGKGGGIFGGTLDSYATAELGLIYALQRGPVSHFCDMPAGVGSNYYNSNSVDYDKITKIVQAAKPAPVVVPEVDYKRIEDMIDKKLDKLKGKETVVSAANGEFALVGINFDTNDATIKAENHAILAQAAATLLANPSIKVEIQGHTDNVGTEKGNKPLSEKRAAAVKKYLVSKGVDESRLITSAFGSTKPVSDNKSVDGKSLNRRVDFKILSK